MATRFLGKLPGGFYEPVKKEVVTMETVKKGVRVGDRTVYDTEKVVCKNACDKCSQGP